ncbi:MAG: hypothetical protein K5765_06660 [Clostridia bacterium]|nr:hypothetical protein [Clostridia bacterium]
MEKEEYLDCLRIMAELEGQWYIDEEGIYKFFHPEQVSPKAIRAAELLTENDKEADDIWDKFIEMYGASSFEDEYTDED